MTKEDAVIAMNSGYKITHSYYSENEYAYMEDGIIYTEEGYPHGTIHDDFWQSIQVWNDGWSLYEKNLIIDIIKSNNEYKKNAEILNDEIEILEDLKLQFLISEYARLKYAISVTESNRDTALLLGISERSIYRLLLHYNIKAGIIKRLRKNTHIKIYTDKIVELKKKYNNG